MICGFCCHLEASEIQEVLAAIPWDFFLEMYRFFFPLAAQVGSRKLTEPDCKSRRKNVAAFARNRESRVCNYTY